MLHLMMIQGSSLMITKINQHTHRTLNLSYSVQMRPQWTMMTFTRDFIRQFFLQIEVVDIFLLSSSNRSYLTFNYRVNIIVIAINFKAPQLKIRAEFLKNFQLMALTMENCLRLRMTKAAATWLQAIGNSSPTSLWSLILSLE